ncbi:hypothetical protein V8Z74_14820 [Comamonas sp. w2-DMI]|uniref:hypothetical protein n=1 Tax=Comamonas sp. w2-DMI TaxID=3126391 RepID=UPI0032E473DC
MQKFSQALGALNLPEVSMALGERRSMQQWMRKDGSIVLAPHGVQLSSARKTVYVIPQVEVEVRAMLPVSNDGFGISSNVLAAIYKRFEDFIEPVVYATPLEVTFIDFFAQLTYALKAIEAPGHAGFITAEHASFAIRRLGVVVPQPAEMKRAEELVAMVYDRITQLGRGHPAPKDSYRNENLSSDYQRFF